MNGQLSFDDLRFRMEAAAGPGDWRLLASGLMIRSSSRPLHGGIVARPSEPGVIRVLTLAWDGTPMASERVEGAFASLSEAGGPFGLERRALEACLAIQLQRAAQEWPLPEDSPIRHDLRLLHRALTGDALRPLVQAVFPVFATWLEE